LDASEGGGCGCGGGVHALCVEDCGAGSAGCCAGEGGCCCGTGIACLLFALAVVASVWLLGEAVGGYFYDGAGTEFAGLDAHEEAMGAAETKSVSFTHLDGRLEEMR